jgi:hypothetical protein
MSWKNGETASTDAAASFFPGGAHLVPTVMPLLLLALLKVPLKKVLLKLAKVLV